MRNYCCQGETHCYQGKNPLLLGKSLVTKENPLLLGERYQKLVAFGTINIYNYTKMNSQVLTLLAG